MEYLCIIVSVTLAVLFFALTRKIYNAGTIFLGYWAIITLLTSLNFDNATPVRQSTYGFILLGLVSFAAGCLLCLSTKHKAQINPDFKFHIVSYRLLNIACIIIIIYSIYRFTIIAEYLLQGVSWGNIRLMHGVAGETGEGTLKGGTWSQIIHDDFVAPWVYLIAPTVAVDLILGNRNKRFILLSLIAMIFYSISSVSRAIWGFLILYLLIILAAFLHRKNISPKVKKWLRRIPIFALILFGIIIAITKSRSETSQVNLLYNMIAYLTGGIRLFDIHLQEPIADIRTYGFFSTYGFIYPVFFLLNYVGILKYPPVFTDIAYIKQQLEVFVTLSDHVRMNAYCTLFFNFYNDFGVFGIFLGSLIFGYFCMLAYIYFVRKKNVRTFVCYLILIQFMIFSMARIYTIYTTRALSLVWLLVLLPKEGNRTVRITFKRKR